MTSVPRTVAATNERSTPPLVAARVGQLTAMRRALAGKLSSLKKLSYAWIALRHSLGLLVRGQITALGKKALKGLKSSSYAAPAPYDPRLAYDRWRQRQALTEQDRNYLRTEVVSMSEKPLISVLMVVADEQESDLREALESILGQMYAHWELCIVDGSAPSGRLRQLVEDYSRRDARIRWIAGEETGSSTLINKALDMAQGTYVAVLHAANKLADQALYSVARAINDDPAVDFLYSDEDRFDAEGHHVDPFFKPDWSPEYLLGYPYACHLAVQRTELVRELGGWSETSAGVEQYDLVLRIAARTSRIKHIADVLYHKRIGKQPTTTADANARVAARLALSHHLVETQRSGSVEPGLTEDTQRVRFTVIGRPLVSIIIPTAAVAKTMAGREQMLVTQCVRGVRQLSTWPNYEIIIVGDPGMPDDVREELTSLGGRVVTCPGPFNFSTTINFGASHAGGQHLVMLNDDTEVISPDWLECMLEFSQQDDVGAVGAMLLFPNGRLQHAGIALLGGHPLHAFPDYPYDHPGHGFNNHVPRNCCAVTGACLMTRYQVFRDLGGLDTAFPLEYNDIDYCLRLQTTGRSVVVTPYARLYHYEATTRGKTAGTGRDLFRARWAKVFSRDPYYNVNLCNASPNYHIDPEAAKAYRESSMDTLPS